MVNKTRKTIFLGNKIPLFKTLVVAICCTNMFEYFKLAEMLKGTNFIRHNLKRKITPRFID